MAVVLVIGASRGIGRGLVQACLQRGDRVLATVRKPQDVQALRAAGAEVLVVDVAQPSSVSGLSWQLDGIEINLAWYVAGVWDGSSASSPPPQEQFDHVMHTNVLGAMQVLPQVMPCVEAAGGTMVCISSQMSRLAQADSHAWLYRTSKAALNMVVASAQSAWPWTPAGCRPKWAAQVHQPLWRPACRACCAPWRSARTRIEAVCCAMTARAGITDKADNG